MKKKLLTIIGATTFLCNVNAQITTQTISFTGATQSLVLPNCVNTISVQLYGAQGNTVATGGTGGLGGMVSGNLTVTPGSTLYLNVGGQNGFNGGGTGAVNGNTVGAGPSVGNAGNGGGASDIRIGGTALANRVMVAGGGGGGARQGNWPGCQPGGTPGNGGLGGGLTGGLGSTGTGTSCNCAGTGGNGGQGGTQVAGGAAGTYNGSTCLQTWGTGNAGTLGQGGNGSLVFHNGTGGAGGGGGGYYGGGSGGSGSDTTPGGGGGGGSSFLGSATNTANTQGTNAGNGYIIISYSSSSTNLTVNSSTNNICPGGSVLLTASNANTYTWSTSSNSSSIVVTPTITSTYTVSGTNSLSCSSSQTISVNVNPTPSVSITGTSQICAGSSLSLTANGASTYSWNTGATTNSIVATPTSNITYSATGTGTNGCSSMATQAVTVNALPSLSVSVSSNSVCANGSTISLNGNPTGGVFTGSNVSNGLFTPGSNAGNFTQTYAYTNTVTGCSNTATSSITVLNCTEIASNILNNKLGVNIFPNPSDGILNVELNSIKDVSSIKIINALCQVVYAQNNLEMSNKIDLSNYKSGIYFIEIKSGDKTISTYKIIKN